MQGSHMITRIIEIKDEMRYICGKRHHYTDDRRNEKDKKPHSASFGKSGYLPEYIGEEYCRNNKLHYKEI